MGKREYLGEFEQLILLTIVRLGDKAYGARMRAEIERRYGRTVSIGQLYTALNRLEAKSLVSSRLADPTPVRGGRTKRYFQVEPGGLEALRRCRELVTLMWKGLDPGIL
jgi:PadR family transcriptional regulator PadR